MRLGIFLALVGSSLALQSCSVGNLMLTDGVITDKSIRKQQCMGECMRTTITVTENKKAYLFTCQENEYAILKNEIERVPDCLENKEAEVCACREHSCTDIDAPEELVAPVISQDDDALGPLCYIGYYSKNTTAAAVINNGVTTNCANGMQCSGIMGSVSGYDVEAYMCMTSSVCDTIQNPVYQPAAPVTFCGTVQNDNVQMCCCNGNNANCTNLPKILNPNNGIIVPAPSTQTSPGIQCYTGAQLNYSPIGNFVQQTCYGDCASVHIRTYMNMSGVSKAMNLDLFTCDPVAVCSMTGITRGCGNIVEYGDKSVLRACCCGKDKCIDPTQQPPKYPLQYLKCYTGFYNTVSNVSNGGEIICNSGQCGRLEVPYKNGKIKYYMCAPYSMCYGLGIAGGDQCYFPPQEEENKVCCCASGDNCNVQPTDNVNTTSNITDVTYPILCYGGLWLNNAPVTTGSYGLCDGECAMVNFQMTVFNQTHNTTLYTCDPANVCKSQGISNSCANITDGVTGCCCDVDVCYDPNRPTSVSNTMTCFTGLYVKEDNLLTGGEMNCQGWCASLGTTMNGKNTTSFWCAPWQTCRYFALGQGGDYNCQPLNTITHMNTVNSGTACCCTESDNCNVLQLFPQLASNITAIPAPKNDPPLVCYEGIWINGNNTNPTNNYQYQVCNGVCSYIQLKNASDSGRGSELYTCDSSAACTAMGLQNSCNTIDGVRMCCCDTNACIDPTVNRWPDKNLTCYVGVQSSFVNQVQEMLCPSGYCASITSFVNGVNFKSLHCMPKAVCRGLGLDNTNGTALLGDRNVTGMCCDTQSLCNGPVSGVVSPPRPLEAPIVCWNGVEVEYTGQTNLPPTYSAGSGWSSCQGECMSLNIATTYQGANATLDIFSCDPTALCNALNLTNICHNLEPGVRACCCNTDACINPKLSPPKYPGRLMCSVGVQSNYNNFSVITETECQGQCLAISGSIMNYSVAAFGCVNQQVCSALSLWEDCETLPGDNVQTCCCDTPEYRDSTGKRVTCNSRGFNLNNTIQPSPSHDYRVACWSGVTLNNQMLTKSDNYVVCQGDCASVSFTTIYNGKNTTAEIFTCDPASVCKALNLENNCGTLDNLPGLQGCCCNTNDCLDPNTQPIKRPGPLQCAVGLIAGYNAVNNVTAITTVQCKGKCAQMWGSMNGTRIDVFMCLPATVCNNLEDDRVPTPIPGTPLTGFCCDQGSFCNIDNQTLQQAITPTPRVEYPITCYSGMYSYTYGSNSLTSLVTGAWQSCNGECAMTELYGQQNSTMIYSCDPSNVCQQMGVTNGCKRIEGSAKACCCNSNGCLDPTVFPPKEPYPLQCYTGVQSAYYNISAGASTFCNGKCASVVGNVGNGSVSVFACIATPVCLSLELQNSCAPLQNDSYATACCCDNYNFCNMDQANFTLPNGGTVPPPQIHQYPITCWNGINVNGRPLAEAGWQACQGDCVSIELDTVVNRQTYAASLYTCDPSQVCTQLNVINNCANLTSNAVSGALKACCCNTNTCIDPRRNKYPDHQRICYVGVKAVGNGYNYNSGASMPCPGSCAAMYGNIGNMSVTTFHCIDTSICVGLELDNACGNIQAPGGPIDNVQACCCDDADYCNLRETGNTGVIIPPTVTPFTEPPITCLSAIYINGKPVSTPTYTTCQGLCMYMSINTTMNNGQMPMSTAFYGCDPSYACYQMNITNQCQQIVPGVEGCCCDSNVCVTEAKKPLEFTCTVGIRYDNSSDPTGYTFIGSQSSCDGKCMSVKSTIGSGFFKVNAEAYACVTNRQCETLNVYNNCTQIWTDRAITGCCCDNAANCNSADYPSLIPSTLPTTTPSGNAIACPSGITVNNQPLGNNKNLGVVMCNGECAAIQFDTSAAGVNSTFQLYVCDPVAVCQQLNLVNQCSNISTVQALNGTLMTACCCNTGHMCIDGSTIYPNGNTNGGGTTALPVTTTKAAGSINAFVITALLAAIYNLLQ